MVPHSLVVLITSLIPSLRTSFPAAPFHPPMKSEFTKFIDPLPIPRHYQVRSSFSGAPVEIVVPMTQFKMKMHSDLAEQTVWGYAGSSPGPVIDVESGQKVRVHWRSQLPSTHVFPAPKLDLALKTGLCLPTTPDVRTVTHLHGAEVTESSPLDRLHNNDGWPDSWILPGAEQIADYPNQQSARTLWYHDHAMGTTGRNLAAGLVGFYLIHDNYERSLNLPNGAYDIPLMIRSHSFNDDGNLEYTNDSSVEYYGNTVSVNGKLWPHLNVEPRKYRFRLINGSNARSYAMKVVDFKDETDGPAIYQIGSDSGFLENTVVFNEPGQINSPRLLIAPGERADVIIDFSKFAGKTLLLHNTSRDPGDGEIAMPELMTFNVVAQLKSPDLSQLPLRMKPIVRIRESEATATRRVVFGESKTPAGDTMLTLNGRSWLDPIEEKPKLGATEVWDLINTLPDVHPFHIHLVQFQILDRTPFDAAEFVKSGKVILTGAAQQPDPNEMGWKDTVRLPGEAITRIIMRFLPYPGFYVYHCHILEHEDMDMMRPFQVVAPSELKY